METLVVVDKKLIDYHRQYSDIQQADGLTPYVLTIMNIVSTYNNILRVLVIKTTVMSLYTVYYCILSYKVYKF